MSGIITGDVQVSFWPISFFPSLLTVPEVCAKVHLAQSPSCF